MNNECTGASGASVKLTAMEAELLRLRTHVAAMPPDKFDRLLKMVEADHGPKMRQQIEVIQDAREA